MVETLKPLFETLIDHRYFLAAGFVSRQGLALAQAPQQQAHPGGKRGLVDHRIDHAMYAAWRADAHRQVEGCARLFEDARQFSRAPREDNAGRQQAIVPGFAYLFLHFFKDFLHPRLDDLRQGMLVDILFIFRDKRFQIDARSCWNLAGVRVAVRDLQVFGSQEWDTQTVGNIIGDEVATQRQNHRVPDGAFHENSHVSRAAADVQQDDAQVFFAGSQDGFAGGQRLQNQIIDLDLRLLDAFDQVLDGGNGARDNMTFDLQPVARHANRVLDALLSIHQIAARDDVNDLAAAGHFDSPRGFNRPADVAGYDFARVGRDSNHTSTIQRFNMATGHTDVG